MTDASKNILHRRLLPFLFGAFVLELIAFTALQYRLPSPFRSLWDVNQLGAGQFAGALFGRVFSPLGDREFRLVFRVLLIAIYVTYAAVIVCLRRGPAIGAAKALTIVAVAGTIAAVLFPPSLSSDIYSYAAYAQLPARHLNPYFHSPQALIDAGDPIARFLPKSILDPARRRIAWDIPTVYGSVWTVLSIAAARIGGAFSLWGAVLSMKLIEAGALIVAAFSAGRIARLRHPDQAGVAVLIVGLNPLALIEGVGSGHNDLLMIAFALLAAAWLQERKPALGGLALGVSIGVKFVTLGLLPWLLIDLWRASAKEDRLRVTATAGAAALLPSVLCYLPFWHGLATLGALASRNGVIDAARGASAHPHHLALLSVLHEHQTILILYAALTAALAATRIRGAWVLAWAIFSGAFIYYSLGIWFPWYMLWPWLVLLASGFRTTAQGALSFMAGTLALALEILYTIDSGVSAFRLLEASVYVCVFAAAATYFHRWKRQKKN